MKPLILVVGAVIALYFSYLMNLVSSNVYLSDYEEERFIANARKRKRAFLTYLLKNPMRLAVTATLTETLCLTAITVLLYHVGVGISIAGVAGQITGVVLALLGWIVHLSLTEMLAPNIRQHSALRQLASRTLLIKLFVVLFSPLVSFVLKQKERMVDEQELEERKEEIVERAIETLADSAGFDEPLMEREEREMIENIFELGETEVREVMVPRIDMVAIEVGTSFTDIQEIAARSGYSRFPLYKDDIDNIRGIIYLKDLFRAVPFAEGELDLLKFAREPYFVPESKILDSLLQDFKRQHAHIAIVVDEFGGTAGLVTLEDLLEIIVGDIQDEHDVEEAELVKLSDTSYLVSANLSMEDLSEQLNLRLEEKDFETVGGYIYDLVGSLPKIGQRIESGGITYTVEKIKGQRIEKVRITLAPNKRETATD